MQTNDKPRVGILHPGEMGISVAVLAALLEADDTR
jgi:hypothetical protein